MMKCLAHSKKQDKKHHAQDINPLINVNMPTIKKYDVGASIQSTSKSSDVRLMKAIWKGEICKVMKNGYMTLGKFYPMKDKKGKHMHSFWDDYNGDISEPTLRQLPFSEIESI